MTHHEYGTHLARVCNKLGVKCYKMPKVETVVQGLHQSGSGFQKIDITDLLGRQEIRLDESRLGTEITGKTILVTGAGGSIGSEICRQVSRFNPERIVLLGHGENSIYLVYHELIRTFPRELIMFLLLQIFRTMTVSCRCLSSTNQPLFIMLQPTNTFR